MEGNYAELRRMFPLLERKAYFSSGSYAALATPVEQAMLRYLSDRQTYGAAWDQWVGRNEAVRGQMARLLNVTADEIAITASASAGINALATSLDFTGKRNRVVTTDLEFPTGGQIWHAQKGRGAEVVHAGRNAEGWIPLEAFDALIDDRTAIVAVTHVCYSNGARLDIEGVIRLAHARGTRVLLDCYQSVGARHLDFRALDVDFATGGMLKYLLGTAGIGFFYCRADHIAGLRPTVTGWFAQDDVGAMDATRYDPSVSARRFEAGTPPVPSLYAVEAGLDLILSIGTLAIEARVEGLTGQCMDRLIEIGWPAVTPRNDSLRGPTVAIPSRDPAGLVEALLERDIVTSWRDGNVRAAYHFYNNEDDTDRLIAALAELRPQFAP